MANGKNRYKQIIEYIFLSHYTEGAEVIEFKREELKVASDICKIPLPKNLGDVIYSVRYREGLPESILNKIPKGKTWIIRPAGKGVYRFVSIIPLDLIPNSNISETKVPNATPGIVDMYSLSDEQALLAKLRYNRLLDIMTGVTCYSLQNHLRTFIESMGQIETDEIYVGIDRRGAHFVFPIQAKGGKDKLNIVQIEQDIAMCQEKFPDLICRPIGAQFMSEDIIALFIFEQNDTGISVSLEKHYRLVNPSEISPELLVEYSNRLPDV